MDNDKLIKALDDAGHRESALLLKNWGEMDSNAEALSKSNDIKPFGQNIYDEKANVGRKIKRTGEEVANTGKNVAVQAYATSGSSMQAAHEVSQAKAQKKKTKASTKTMKDFSPEQIKEMEDKANKKNQIKKSNTGQWELDGTETTLLFKTNETKQAGKNEVIERKKVDMDSAKGKAIFNDFADSIRAGVPKQPTDEQLFGHLVKSQADVDAAEKEWGSKMDFYSDWTNGKIKTSGEKAEDNESWASGTSFNSSLSQEELKKRNSEVGE